MGTSGTGINLIAHHALSLALHVKVKKINALLARMVDI
jgi:hypothetical protein